MLLSFPECSTERLQLRHLKAEDAPQIFLLRSDEMVNRFINRERAVSINDAVAFINKIKVITDKNEGLFWAISTKETGQLMGTICFWNLVPEKASAEIGYELLPEFQGKGFMQEAISIVIEHGFETAGFNVIEAVPRADNDRSVKLLIKNNFIRDTEAEKTFTDEERAANLVIYSLRKNSWRNSRIS
jgi:[ribosomal protein S5]-alanine N-acetyltransferase